MKAVTIVCIRYSLFHVVFHFFAITCDFNDCIANCLEITAGRMSRLDGGMVFGNPGSVDGGMVVVNFGNLYGCIDLGIPGSHEVMVGGFIGMVERVKDAGELVGSYPGVDLCGL